MATYKFPTGIKFSNENDGYTVHYVEDKKLKYELDIWGIAYALHHSNVDTVKSVELNIILPSDFSEVDKCSLYLRHYFLRDVLPIMSVTINGSKDFLEEAKEIISKIESKDYITYSDDKKGPSFNARGTKKKLESEVEKAILLDDYFGGFSEKKRQWPANIFEKTISRKNRKTRSRWIDMVAIDNKDRLSAIEIKSGDNLPLDLFVQNFDYMVFLHLFKEHVLNEFFKSKIKVSLVRPVCGYFVIEKLHPLLTNVLLKHLKDSQNFYFEMIKYTYDENHDGSITNLKIID